MIFASLALRTAMLINGGAAIAALNFLSNLKTQLDTNHLVNALQIYCLGVGLAAFSVAIAYFAQSQHLERIKNKDDRK
jgi:hypothetical protein